MPLKEQLPKLLKIENFEPFSMQEIRIKLIKTYESVLFYPFYDRGSIRGYGIVANKKVEGRPVRWEEQTIKDVCLFNATHHKKKLWILLTKRKALTVLI